MRWTYNLHATQWEATFDGWRATVESHSTSGTWHAALTRRYPPYHNCDQTDFGWLRAAMAWCESEMMRQRRRGWSADSGRYDNWSPWCAVVPPDGDAVNLNAAGIPLDDLASTKKEPTMTTPQMLPRYQPGDRVRVDKTVSTMPALPGYIGIVKEVIPCHADNTIGYNLALEDDPRPSRVWFFFQRQLTPA